MQFKALTISLLLFSTAAWAVDPALRPAADASDAVAGVYRDMIVVQRKAKQKEGSYLAQVSESMDFSDGPEQYFSTNLAFGYALSDRFEIYANFVPYTAQVDRPIKSAVSNLTLADGDQAALVTPKPTFQYGIEALWLPAYGKDSWGPHHIIRSDTFFKLSLANVNYSDGGSSGFKGAVGVGKTFFLGTYFNPRVTAAYGVRQTTLNSTKSNSQFGLLEIGNVFYF